MNITLRTSGRCPRAARQITSAAAALGFSFFPMAAAPVLAQDATIYVMPRIPSEEEKIEALKLAYILNGFSMTRPLSEGSIDIRYTSSLGKTAPPPNVVRTIPITPPEKPKQKMERFK